MDFVDKKEKLATLIEKYIHDSNSENELLTYIKELSEDSDFISKELFKNIFDELLKYLPELSRKELKQRILMIRGFIE